jgi:hypothetical protein
MPKISKWLQDISTGWIAFVALVIFLVFSATVLPRQAAKADESSGGGSPDMSFTYTTVELYTMAEAFGEGGRKAYIQARFTFDFIFPLVYTSFLATSISWVSWRAYDQHSKWQMSNLAPVLGMVFDYLENASTSLVMARFPNQTPIVDWLAPIFTSFKWIFVGGSFVLLFISLIVATWRWVKPKIKNND